MTRVVQARGFLSPPRIHCPTCQLYAWDMRVMQPVYVGSEAHHPSCIKVRGRVEAPTVGMARVRGARVATWEDDQKLAYNTGYSHGYIDGKSGAASSVDPAGQKGSGVVIDEGTKLAFDSGYYSGYKAGSEKTPSTSTPPVDTASPTNLDAFVKANKWGPFAGQKEAVLWAMGVVRSAVPGANDNFVDIATGIGLAESEFGLTFPWRLPNGMPSYNWGALHRGSAPCTQGMVFTRGDKNAKGDVVQAQFAAFPSMAQGFACFLKIWNNSDVENAANDGNATYVAAAMYARRYFEGCGKKCGEKCCGNNEERILEYGRMLQGAAARVAGIAGRATKVFVGEVPKSWRNLTVALNPSAPYPGDAAGGDNDISATSAGGIGLLVGMGIGAGALFLLAKRGKISI
jgi:hypothetical protein